MKLKSNFYDDWIDQLQDILENHWGYDLTNINKSKMPFVYFNAEKRRPKPTPRRVELSDTFTCPGEHTEGWEQLKLLVENGGDLTSNLSKLVGEINNIDPLLNDWGIHHFHLGKELEGKYIKRTGPLLFALLTDDNFFAVGVFLHGEWTNLDVIETIHRNWPGVISGYKVENITLATNIGSDERNQLRKNKVNSFTAVDDGTVYLPIGGGTSTSGFNIQATMSIQKQQLLLKSLEKDLQKNLDGIFSKLGLPSESDIEAKLEITDNAYYVFFPKHSFRLILLEK